MGVRFTSTFSTPPNTNVPSGGAETLLCSLGPLQQAVDAAPVYLQWSMVPEPGTGTTSLTVRIRHGVGIAGALLGAAPWTMPALAAAAYPLGGWYFDPSQLGMGGYSLTIQCTGASANSLVINPALLAYIL